MRTCPIAVARRVEIVCAGGKVKERVGVGFARVIVSEQVEIVGGDCAAAIRVR